MKTLILGGIKSGKSKYAEQCAHASGKKVTIIATATAEDEEMRERILKHQQQRDNRWSLIEEPIQLDHILEQHSNANNCLLIDCLTLWLCNLLSLNNKATLQAHIDNFVIQVKQSSAQIIMVSNETSMGIIPMGELTRQYCDEAGKLHQQIAQHCDRVVLTIAGLPQFIKGAPDE